MRRWTASCGLKPSPCQPHLEVDDIYLLHHTYTQLDNPRSTVKIMFLTPSSLPCLGRNEQTCRWMHFLDYGLPHFAPQHLCLAWWSAARTLHRGQCWLFISTPCPAWTSGIIRSPATLRRLLMAAAVGCIHGGQVTGCQCTDKQLLHRSFILPVAMKLVNASSFSTQEDLKHCYNINNKVWILIQLTSETICASHEDGLKYLSPNQKGNTNNSIREFTGDPFSWSDMKYNSTYSHQSDQGQD